jgi:CRP-like cAMP-binding protein
LAHAEDAAIPVGLQESRRKRNLTAPQEFREESQKLRDMRIGVDPNLVVFSEGENSREMYILLSGKVEILKNNKRIAVVEGEGSYLGELSTLLGVPRTATVKTMSRCEFIVVKGENVNDFFDCSPALGLKLAKILADRLAKMNVGYVKLEQRADALSAKLRDASEKLKMRDQQIRRLVARIEQVEQP